MSQRALNILVITVSCFMLGGFTFGALNWSDHWWVLAAWFMPLLGGWPTIVKHTQTKRKTGGK